MNDLTWLFIVLTLASSAGNAYLFRQTKKQKKQSQSQDATMLMHHLTRRGAAVIKVTVVDPQDIFLRSPRDFG
jgi:hypothetical protein